MRLAIFGTGGMGREVADIVRRQMPGGCRWSSLVFVTDDPGDPVQDIPVIGPDALLPDDEICFAVGSSSFREKLAARFPGQRKANVISPTALVSPSATIGDGATLCDYTVVNNSARIGRHFQANVFAQVSHDCIIGDFVTLSPRVSCNGSVRIGDGVFVGAGAVIRNGAGGEWLTIGAGATIGMGSVVTRDVPTGATVMGVPAVVTESGG